MKSEALLAFTDTHWTVLALLLFFTFFSVLIYRVCWSKESQAIERMKWTVFGSEENHER